MRRLGSVIVEAVERFRSDELKRLAAQAELRALQAQINPHFLFNAFNTLYGTIDRESFEARRLVLNLTEIFRYFLQGDRSFILLSEEIRIIKAYLEIEALRLGDRLETELHISESALSVMIPILSIQPLVENAVKHGVAAKAGRGRVVLRIQAERGDLHVSVEDTGRVLETIIQRSTMKGPASASPMLGVASRSPTALDRRFRSLRASSVLPSRFLFRRKPVLSLANRKSRCANPAHPRFLAAHRPLR